mmetsp:Transcript_74358/g.177403  ORF Transcript_74358/g.177403 Transcript_74358/m.177403 type:complete len:216 (+) Transcript_74358:279-926(+)
MVSPLHLIGHVSRDAVRRRRSGWVRETLGCVGFELLLQGIVTVGKLDRVLPLKESGRQHQPELVVLHRKLEGHRSTDEVAHLVHHNPDLRPRSATFVSRARPLKAADVAAELGEKEWLREGSEVICNRLVRGVLEAAVGRIAPGVGVETEGIHCIVGAFQCAGQVVRDVQAVLVSLVLVRVDEWNTPVALLLLVSMDVARERFHTRVCRHAFLVQ